MPYPMSPRLTKYILILSVLSSSTIVAQTLLKREQQWAVEFSPTELLELPIDSYQTVEFTTTDLEGLDKWVVTVESDQPDIASVGDENRVILLHTRPVNAYNWTASFNVTGHFIGYAKIRLKLRDKNSDVVMNESKPLPVTVMRQLRVIDHVFTITLAVLISIVYINFGCALDWEILKKTVKRPIGPAIGLFSQFCFMPLISFGLGKVLFPDSVQMQLGMFFTGVSPGGGGSNVWTYALDGNINLSMTMTAMSTLAAFAMMPFWIFTLGQLIFSQANITIPYAMIAGFALALIIPLSIGLLIQRYLPRVSKIMVRILKPLCLVFLVFIIIFATFTNLYLFKLFTWRIVVASIGLPWIGFLLGMLSGMILRQPTEDVIAIAVETGIQNTAIGIFLLRTLGQPDADLTSVVPVAVGMMTPFPLIIAYFVRKWWTKRCKKAIEANKEEKDTSAALI